MQTNTSTHLQCTHHSSLHGFHHTGRNRGAIVSHCTRDMYWLWKISKILRVHKLWPMHIKIPTCLVETSTDIAGWIMCLSMVTLVFSIEIHGAHLQGNNLDTSWITFGWLSCTSNKFYNEVKGILKGVCRESVVPQWIISMVYGTLGYSWPSGSINYR